MRRLIRNWFYYIILGAVLYNTACSSDAAPEEETNKAPLSNVSRDSQQGVLVKVYKALPKKLELGLQVLGRVEAGSHVETRFQLNGYLAGILIRNGSNVQKGQVLAILEKGPLELNLRKAQNDLALAKEAYIQQIIEYGGDPFKENTGIAPDLQQRIAIRTGVTGAALQVEEAQQSLNFATLRSPITGTIADLQLKPGNMINTSQVLCTVYSQTNLELITQVLETQSTRLALGQSALVDFLAIPQKKYKAIVHEINPKVSAAGMVQVKLKLLETKDIFPGMNAEAQIFSSLNNQGALVVPREAIVLRSGRKVVFTVVQSEAKWNYVETGLENSEEVEILKGISEGAQVIVSNNLQLNNGSPVIVQKTE